MVNRFHSREQILDNGKPFSETSKPISVHRAIILQMVNRLCQMDNRYLWITGPEPSYVTFQPLPSLLREIRGTRFTLPRVRRSKTTQKTLFRCHLPVPPLLFLPLLNQMCRRRFTPHHPNRLRLASHTHKIDRTSQLFQTQHHRHTTLARRNSIWLPLLTLQRRQPLFILRISRQLALWLRQPPKIQIRSFTKIIARFILAKHKPLRLLLFPWPLTPSSVMAALLCCLHSLHKSNKHPTPSWWPRFQTCLLFMIPCRIVMHLNLVVKVSLF